MAEEEAADLHDDGQRDGGRQLERCVALQQQLGAQRRKLVPHLCVHTWWKVRENLP